MQYQEYPRQQIPTAAAGSASTRPACNLSSVLTCKSSNQRSTLLAYPSSGNHSTISMEIRALSQCICVPRCGSIPGMIDLKCVRDG